jgi:hypothetical protein
MSVKENIKELLMQKTIEELLQSSFVKNSKGSALLAFNGVMSQESIVGLGEVLRSELHQYHPLNIVNKIFAIYIEMTQNVLHYSFLKSDSNGKSIGLGSIFVFSTPGGYRLVTANVVSEQQKNNLEKKCEMINSLNEDQIKDHYLNRRRKLAEGDSKGAGLGFFDIVRRSGMPVEFAFEPINEGHYIYYLGSNILVG